MKRVPISLAIAGLLTLYSCHKNDRSTNPEENLAVALTESLPSLIQVEWEATTRIPYQGPSVAAFPDGLPLSIGSGLRAYGYDPASGDTLLLGLSDRGPNADGPALLNADKTVSGLKIFPVPDYHPQIFQMRYHPSKGLRLAASIEIKEGDQPISGRPTPVRAGSATTGDRGIGENLLTLGFDENGLDPEGIDVDSKGRIWICDEYGPFLVQVEAQTGKILKKLAPGAGLPEILKHRQSNRGFEGLALADNGRVYAIVQSTLDIAGQTKKLADFIRLVEYDPASGTTRMFAYPVDASRFGKTSDAKLGDLLALGQGRFAVIEQGEQTDKQMHNEVYEIDINEATDLSGQLIAQGPQVGRDLEYTRLDQLAQQGIKPVKKALLKDLRSLGWTQDKAEGLAILNDGSFLVISDNDFGLAGVTVDGPSAAIDDYKVDEAGGLYYKGSAVQTQVLLKAGPTFTELLHWKQ